MVLPTTFVHSITSEQLFAFLSISAGLMTLTYSLHDKVFGRFLLWPWPRIVLVKYGICYIYAKNGSLNEKQTYRLNSRPEIWPSFWLWPWPWPWNFKVNYEIWCISAKNGRIAMKWEAIILIELQISNVTIRFDLGHDLTWNFQGQELTLLYLMTKWSLIAMKWKMNISIEY